MVIKLLVILGPTAVGKTDLSLRAAEALGGEIISADSRLFYRFMDIGTAKPSPAELNIIPHHLINICDPDESLSLGQYQRMVFSAIKEITARGKLPVLVGGTGQYIMAVIEGWGIPEVPPHPNLRVQLQNLGQAELNRWLKELDPVAEEKIDPRNIRRVVRALEVVMVTGIPISKLQRKTPPGYDLLVIGLNRSRETLYERIDHRVDKMMENGFLDEVIQLRNSGLRRELSSMSGLGYRQLMAYLEDEVSLDEAVERTKFETHRFARQQYTWFRQDDPRIHWFDLDVDGNDAAALDLAKEWVDRREELN